MKKIDFRKVMIEMNFGSPEVVDVRQLLGNNINQRTGDIALADLARKIYYSDGPVEIPAEFIEPITAIVRNSNLIAPAKVAIIALLADNNKVKPSKK